MADQREETCLSAPIHDPFASQDASQIGPSFFDPDLRAWVLSRHADLLAAFHAASLIPGRRDLTTVSLEPEERARRKMREEVREALCPGKVRAWREELRSLSHHLCEQLDGGEPVDLISCYGRPLCLRFAAMVSGITPNAADNLAELAQIASAATANPDDLKLRAHAEDANRVLRTYFDRGADPLRDSFIALSQTLLRLISAAWFALIRHPDQWSLLRSYPQSADQAFEELFRYAGVIRVLWRTATEDIDLNGALIRRGDHVLLRVLAGSHDPEHVGKPETLDCARHGRHHFAFGAGGHSCVAANLNRMAAVTMTLPLLARFRCAQLARPVEWHGGSILWSPAALWVILSCS